MAKESWLRGGSGAGWGPGGGPPSRKTGCDAEALARFGRGLRAMYAGVVSEPLPEHLAAVLRKLEAERS
jgi:Anti-sigma factor NepR